MAALAKTATTASHFAQLQRELVRIYPKLSGVSFELGWDGVVDWSIDRIPFRGIHRKI